MKEDIKKFLFVTELALTPSVSAATSCFLALISLAVNFWVDALKITSIGFLGTGDETISLVFSHQFFFNLKLY